MSTTAPSSPAATPAAAPPEATVRALVAGCGIGLLLAAGNVYTGLKTGFIDGGNIAAALIGFLIFSGVKSTARRRYGILENNITQTTAASAAVMILALGVAGPVPALGLMNITPPGWAIAIWSLAAGVLGIAAGVVLRQKLIVDDALPFPTGRATAEVIETIQATRAAAMRRAWLLAGAAGLAMAITWFREGSPKVIPSVTPFGGTLAGVAVATLTLGMNWSPLLVSVGAMIGPRGGTSVLLGGTIAWAVIAPRLLRTGIVSEATFGALSSWLVWPALGLLLAGSFVPLLLDTGSLRRAFRDLGALARRGANDRPAQGQAGLPVRPRVLLGMCLASIVVLVVVGRMAFGFGTAATLIAVAIGLVLTNVSARATGETDVGPVGAMGMLTQVAFAGAGKLTSLLNGGLSMATSTQACQQLYAFRAGERLGASPRAQVGAQLLGAVVGAAVVMPVYFLLVKTYGIGTQALPAPGAQSWRAMADAIVGGTASLPPYGPTAGAVGCAAGAVLALCARTRLGRFVPSPAALGMAMLIPGAYSLAIFVGAVGVMIARRLRPGLEESHVMTVAAGGMAGESLMGVVVAALTATGVL
jgi:uncharacterized oligopeptide transporter (OPT) family protein